MIKAVIIGFAHMHVNEVAIYITNEPNMELSACADVTPKVPEVTKTRYTRGWNMENIKNNYCSVIYDNYIKMLEDIKPDIAFILTETYKKPEIVKQCALRGINVSIEKPMAMSYSEALEIQKHVKDSGIFAMVNWPLTWRPYLHQMKNALDLHIIGDLIKIRFLIGNTGPVGRGAMHRGVSDAAEQMTDNDKSKMWWYQKECGGGAVLDFCCYGCMFSNWVTNGKAESVFAVADNLATDFSDVYDNCVATIKYKHSLSVIEGTWTTPSVAIPAGPVLYGTDGILACKKDEDGNIKVIAYDIYGKEISVPEISYPKHMENIAVQYAHHITTGDTIHKTLSLDFNMETMAILDKVLLSAENHKEEKVTY